jgi:hypothetical protein
MKFSEALVLVKSVLIFRFFKKPDIHREFIPVSSLIPFNNLTCNFSHMRGEQLSDAILYDKLNLLKKDFYGYVEHHTAKVDANLPVFYGHVISALENSFPDLADDLFDEFIDGITYKVLDASRETDDFEYIRKVMASALRSKKRKNAEMGINIVVGLKLLKKGDCIHALEYLKDYSLIDAKLGIAIAHCYYLLSRCEFRNDDNQSMLRRPGEMELLAREKMLSLAHEHPPLHRLKQLEIEDSAFLEKIFWQMIFLGLEWFPSERWFIEVGLKNAIDSGNSDMRKCLLDIGSERFYTDMLVLREMYNYKLETRDAGGAAGVVNQMIRQYPDDLEPIYLGLKLSLLTTKKITYHSFRKLASTRRMPLDILELFDIAFDLLMQEKKDAFAKIIDFETEFPHLHYYATILRYLAIDFFSEDGVRVKRARKALLDSVEQFCLNELQKIHEKQY